MVTRRKSVEPRANGAARAPRPVHYPERDGKPMGETPIHRDEIFRLIQTLQGAYADREDVYVSGNMMMYYEEGNPRAVISPDVFVAYGVPKLPERRVYKIWEETPPDFIIEVTSRSTGRGDRSKKLDLYARLDVREYVLYDPLDEYHPPLQGFVLMSDRFEPMPLQGNALVSARLNMLLLLEDGRLRLFDEETYQPFFSPAEKLALDADLRRESAKALDQALTMMRQLQEANAQQRDMIESQQSIIGRLLTERPNLARLEERVHDIEAGLSRDQPHESQG